MKQTLKFIPWLLILVVHVSLWAQELFVADSPRQIPDLDDGYGVAFRDLNEDGLPDLYLVRFRGLNRLLLNQGTGQPFSDATIISGLGGNLMPQGIHNLELGAGALDVDNDGHVDVMTAGWGVTTRLFKNPGHFPFQDFASLNLQLPLDANGCIGADVNGDGWLDLFLTDEHYSNRLLVNHKHKGFYDETRAWGLVYNGISQGAAFCDVDCDGDPDLYVTNWFGPDLFYENAGDHFIRRKVPIPPCEESFTTNSVTFGDTDNDGDFDFLVTNREGRNFLIENASCPGDTTWRFRDISTTSGMDDASVSYGSVFADFNHDGWLDCFVTNIGGNQCYLNTKDGHFQKSFEESGSGYSTGAACADVDLDGDPDLFVANKDTFSVLYLNTTDNAHYIRFKLTGVRSNRDAIGAHVRLYKAGQHFEPEALLAAREISGGSGYLSMNETTVHFGLDTVEWVDARVRFPSGREILLPRVQAGHTYRIHEYGAVAGFAIRVSRTIALQVVRPVFWHVTGLIAFGLALLVLFVIWGRRRYQWSHATLNGMLAGFLAVVVCCMLLLHYMAVLQLLGVIFIFHLVLVGVLVVISERVLRIRQSQLVYHDMLISLSQKIIHIHDDEALVKTVLETVTAQPFFRDCCVALYDEEHDQFSQLICLGLVCSKSQINAMDMRQEFVRAFGETTHLTAEKAPLFRRYFDCLHAELLVSIQRDGKFYGFIALGGKTLPLRIMKETVDLFCSLANQMAFALENNAYLKQSTEMIRKLTEAQVRETYLEKLEKTNQSLESKNRELGTLYQQLQTTQSQLVQKEKMASLGQLVAGISHELNNPVGFLYANMKQLSGYLERIESVIRGDSISPADEWLNDLEDLIEESVRGAQMVKDLTVNLKTFSHLDQAQWKLSNIHQGLESCLMILTPVLKNRIAVHKSYNADGTIECNLGQLNQVFINLLNNAAQAIVDEGEIQISTDDEGDQIVISVQDNGKGIPIAAQSKIFDPFFTTKDVGEGMGLGLSISYRIVQEHGGSLTFESEEKKGTTFFVRLPHRQPHAQSSTKTKE